MSQRFSFRRPTPIRRTPAESIPLKDLANVLRYLHYHPEFPARHLDHDALWLERLSVANRTLVEEQGGRPEHPHLAEKLLTVASHMCPHAHEARRTVQHLNRNCLHPGRTDAQQQQLMRAIYDFIEAVTLRHQCDVTKGVIPAV